jgi:hypothetical protein
MSPRPVTTLLDALAAQDRDYVAKQSQGCPYVASQLEAFVGSICISLRSQIEMDQRSNP